MQNGFQKSCVLYMTFASELIKLCSLHNSRIRYSTYVNKKLFNHVSMFVFDSGKSAVKTWGTKERHQ
jgi:hypothetical protein